MKEFFLCFVPIFVAVDPLGILPLFMTFTEGMGQKELKRVIIQSFVTALVVAILFLIGGTYLLRLLGLTVADFMVAGGILLLVMSITDIISTDKARRRVNPAEVGAVPLGVPLIAGPALMTTSLLLMSEHGFVSTTLAVTANIILASIVFWMSRPLHRVLGSTGSKVISKLASLLLASISVMIIRKGIMAYLG